MIHKRVTELMDDLFNDVSRRHGKTRLVATLEGHEGVPLVRGAAHEIRAEVAATRNEQRRHDDLADRFSVECAEPTQLRLGLDHPLEA